MGVISSLLNTYWFAEIIKQGKAHLRYDNFINVIKKRSAQLFFLIRLLL